MLEKISKNDFNTIYSIMEQSFPPEEFRPYDEQLLLFDDPGYGIVGIREDGKVVAFAAVWRFEDFTFIEHLASSPSERNRGFGKRMLCEIIGASPCPVCLEVEPPEDELTRRRIGFYERNGMHLNPFPYVQPSISKGRAPVPLLIMSSGSQIDEDTYKTIRATLYKRVYKVEPPL